METHKIVISSDIIVSTAGLLESGLLYLIPHKKECRDVEQGC